MKYYLLGRFQIISGDDESYFPSKSKISQMLGLLLVCSGTTVSVDTLIAELWGENVPRSSLTTLQTYVYHARKIFSTMVRGSNILATEPSGYSIRADAEEIDVKIFERRVGEARRFLDGGDPEKAIDRVDEALRLWRGPVLAGMKIGPVLEAHVTYVNELRFTANELEIEANQRLGRYQELVPKLRLLVAENPLNESLHAQLIRILHKCGRRAEALQAYQNLWRILDAELGVTPAPELRLLQQELLSA
ncbi:AfsR/SARP family transcriptional regulator [Parafrankia sp. FMc2]|uniref:AfsR/SARP family transcriptional regulator n=1 Tax=Parafrankia sp. FMc2 TaxID=3233196 RepID=UPI0034D493EB